MPLDKFSMLIAIYLIYYILRFICLFLYSPIISRLGYGIDPKSTIVCAWGSIRSTYSFMITLVFYEKNVSLPHIPEKIFYAAGTYVLSIFINGSFMMTILNFLGLNEISMAKKINMNNCMKHILAKRERTISLLKMDRIMKECNWTAVAEVTDLRHPYQVQLSNDTEGLVSGYRFAWCGDCKKEILKEPTAKEMKEMMTEAKMRILKAKRMSYARQYENGMLSKEGITILTHSVELALDSPETEIEVKDLQQLTKEGCFTRFIRNRVNKLKAKREIQRFKKPRTYWRRVCYHIVLDSDEKFDIIMLIVTIIYMAFLIVEMYYHPHLLWSQSEKREVSKSLTIFFLIGEVFFTLVFFAEIIMRMLAYSWIYFWSHGVKTFFKFFWNILDFILFIGILSGTIHTILLQVHYESHPSFIEKGIDVLQLLRVLKLFRFFEIFYPFLILFLSRSADRKMAFTYELGNTCITSEKEILDLLPSLIDNKKVREEMKEKIESDRMFITKLLGTIQKDKPWIAITVKTTGCIRIILNDMTEAIEQLKSAGWIDVYEREKLISKMDALYKRVHYIRNVQPSAPKTIFGEVPWMAGDDEVIDFLFENVTVKKFDPGEIVFSEGTVADGIYIVVTGFFVINYTPNRYILKSLKDYGQLPIADYMTATNCETQFSDYIVSGNCIGELSILTSRCYNSVITADSHCQVYVLSRGILHRAMEINPDPVKGLESRLWKVVGMRIAMPILLAVPAYQTFSRNSIKYILERAFVPNLNRYKIFSVTHFIEDIILIEGMILDYQTRTPYRAPCYLPRSVKKLILPTSSLMNVPVHIETKLLIIPGKGVDEYDVLAIAEDTCEMVSVGSSIKCLHHTVLERLEKFKKQQVLLPAVASIKRIASMKELKKFSLSSTPSSYYFQNKTETTSELEETNEVEKTSLHDEKEEEGKDTDSSEKTSPLVLGRSQRFLFRRSL